MQEKSFMEYSLRPRQRKIMFVRRVYDFTLYYVIKIPGANFASTGAHYHNVDVKSNFILEVRQVLLVQSS